MLKKINFICYVLCVYCGLFLYANIIMNRYLTINEILLTGCFITAFTIYKRIEEMSNVVAGFATFVTIFLVNDKNEKSND